MTDQLDDTLPLGIVKTANDALVHGDARLLLAAALTLSVYILRTHALAKAPESWGRVGAALRWLGSTDRGGVVSSVLIAGLGATATALEAGKVSWAAALNTFAIAAMASGLSTWHKKLKPAGTPLPQPPVDAEAAGTPLPQPPVDAEPAATSVEEAPADAEPAEPAAAPVEEAPEPEVVVEKKPKKRATKPRATPRKKKAAP